MSDIRHIHEVIIDNPDFNLTVAAKRDLRELCAWVEEYRKHGQEVLDVSKNRIKELEAENERLTAVLHEVDLLACEAEHIKIVRLVRAAVEGKDDE